MIHMGASIVRALTLFYSMVMDILLQSICVVSNLPLILGGETARGCSHRILYRSTK
jgi:hypothetical protein